MKITDGSRFAPFPENIKDNIVSFLPFDSTYADILGKIDAKYFNPSSGQLYSAAQIEESGAEFVNGRDGVKAIKFGGGFVDIGAFDWDGDFTVSFWVNNLKNSAVFFGNARNIGYNGITFGIAESCLVMYIHAGTYTRRCIKSLLRSGETEGWRFLTVTADRGKGQFSIYLDGKLRVDGTKSLDNGADIFFRASIGGTGGLFPPSVGKTLNNFGNSAKIGCDGFEDRGYSESMADFAIFNKALSMYDVAAIAQGYDILDINYYPLEKTCFTETNAGGSATVTAVVENKGGKTAYNTKVSFGFLGDAVMTDGEREVCFDSIPAGESRTVKWTVKSNSGSAKLFVIFDENGRVSVEKAGKAASGSAGWVSGDLHVHSTHSDGSGTFFENFAYGGKAGIDFINIADHDNSKGWDDAAAAGLLHGITAIRGVEYAINPYTHAVFMGMERELDYYGSKLAKSAVAEFKRVTDGKGLVYVAHPYDGNDPWRFCDAWNAEIDGIEVWNSWFAPNHGVNKSARERWDKENGGGRRLYGISATDTHMAEGVGASYTTVYAEEISVGGILGAFRKGHMYGSNGPVINFTAGGAMMGDAAAVSPNGETVTVNMSGEYIEDLSRVLLIKNGKMIYDKEVGGKSFSQSVEVDVKPGDFIRMELEGKETGGKTLTEYNGYENSAYFIAAPFAFSNPIFFRAE